MAPRCRHCDVVIVAVDCPAGLEGTALSSDLLSFLRLCVEGLSSRSQAFLFQLEGTLWSRGVQNGSPDMLTQAASPQAEKGPVCSVAHPAGSRGDTYPHPVPNTLLFSAQVPRRARFPASYILWPQE